MQKLYHSVRQFVNDHYSLKKIIFALINRYPFYIAYDKIYTKRVNSVLSDVQLPQAISIETFNLCNLKCIMCPYKDMTRAKATMPMELFKKITLDAEAMGVKSLILSFYSEPFLDPHLFERIAFVRGRGMYVMFYSNGTVLNEGKISKLLENPPHKIIFSFDGGTKETYEKIRIGGKFDMVTANIRRLVEERNRRGMSEPAIEVNCTIQKENYHELDLFKKLWNGVVDGYDFGIVDNREGEGHEGGLEVERSKIVYPCRRLWNEMIVLSSGKVALCCVDFDGKVILGDAGTQSLADIWDGELYSKIRDLHRQKMGDKVALCRGCSKLYRAAQVAWW
ncbi:MAG: radical SAM protein [Candidatus Aenigmarchaeota archaeon]|nr:radical SAM protein [Candidatus Aenigmarchaeota archaeon]